MADVSTAYSADVLTSPVGVEGDENQWIFSVPALPDVRVQDKKKPEKLAV